MLLTPLSAPARPPSPSAARERRWAFSYTRLNMHLAAAASASGGCIVVDSTRAGKRFPDSLTATVRVGFCVGMGAKGVEVFLVCFCPPADMAESFC